MSFTDRDGEGIKGIECVGSSVERWSTVKEP